MNAREEKLSAQERLDELRTRAKVKLASVGTLEIKFDEETMRLLLMAADQKKMPLNILLTSWTIERLSSEGLTK